MKNDMRGEVTSLFVVVFSETLLFFGLKKGISLKICIVLSVA